MNTAVSSQLPGDYRGQMMTSALKIADNRSAIGSGRTSALGLIASLRPCADHFRSTPISGHSQCPSACLKGAMNGLRRSKIGAVSESRLSGVQLVEQRLGLLQIARVEAFSEPAVDRSEKIAGFIPLPLITPEPR
jgi:hypothetical protein